jgi:short-subunit dehydrogenase
MEVSNFLERVDGSVQSESQGAAAAILTRVPAMDLTPSSTALVTGANGGIGQAIARALHRAGARVIVSGRRADALRSIADEVGARVIVADLEKRADVTRLAAEAGEVDVLVANAALPASGPLLEFTEEQIERAIEVNLRAPIVLAWRLAPGMVARRRGQIVLVSSLAGKVASPGTSLYSATKFGLRGFALGLREDLRPAGVGVTAVYPGFIRDAGMFAESRVQLPPGVGTRSPEDVADAVLRAVRDDPAEIDVASFEQRFGALLAAVSPAFASRVQGALGAAALSHAVGEGQRHKR